MSDEVKPALTPEEWAEVRDDPTWWADRMQEAAHDTSQHLMTYLDEPYRHHALAALALHGQHFGFTREDIRAINRALESHELFRYTMQEEADTLESLAARIEALLPPEDK